MLRHLANRCSESLRYHCRQVRQGGAGVLWEKLADLFLAPFAFPAVLFIRLLSPFLVVRLGFIYAKRIGHFAVTPELYLCERDAGFYGNKKLDIFYYLKPISNQQLKRMWDRMLLVFPFSRYARTIARLNSWLPYSGNYTVPMETTKDIDTPGFFRRTPPHLCFTESEEKKGLCALGLLGIGEGRPFFCFHARCSSYMEKMFPGQSWNYQNYRDSSVDNYILAAEELCGRGYFAVRMGAVVKEPLKTQNQRVIDYAAKSRSDFMDIYLSAKCSFFISGNSGISLVATIFRKPVLYVNMAPMEDAFGWSPVHLFIPKKYWLKKDKRLMTFEEMLELRIVKTSRKSRDITARFKQEGIEPLENTAEEIRDAAVEMEERLSGKWRSTQDDEELQRKFWRLFIPERLPEYLRNNQNNARVGTLFLRQNRSLLPG
jgi:putative glycosyltransferase (TIGR04372 family)